MEPRPALWPVFVSTITELLGSKKAMMFVATVIATIVARLGFNVDSTTIDHYLVLAGSLILGQGIADHGKGAEEERTRQKKLGLTTIRGVGVGRGTVLSQQFLPASSGPLEPTK